jgi:hypothetical protein
VSVLAKKIRKLLFTHQLRYLILTCTLQNLVNEAQLCLQDCAEAVMMDKNYLAEECECASQAVEAAFANYVDLLEDLRRASEAQLERYQQARLDNAQRLRTMRRALDALLLQK